MKKLRKNILNISLSIGLSILPMTQGIMAQTTGNEKIVEVGEKTEDATKITLVNKTKKTIQSLALKPASETEFGENLLPEKKGIKNKGKRNLYYTYQEDVDYEMQIVLGEKEYVIHNLPVTDAKKITICLDKENDVAYIQYKSEESKENVNTKEDEVALKEAAEEPAVQEEAPVQQEDVQQAPVQQEPVQQAPVQQAPVQQAPVQPAPVAPAAPADNGCLDGAILN